MKDLRKTLQSLPKTLDDTYGRILASISEAYSQDAFRILQWLVYSARPLLLEEVAEVVAVNAEESQFDPEDRLTDPRDVLTICSSLVTMVAVPAKYNNMTSHEIIELRLAHFSVKEYLMSDQIRTGLTFQYNIQSKAEEEITQTCLAYLLYFQGDVLNSENPNTFPLAQYAAERWCHHFRAMTDSDQATELGMQLFQGDTFMNWIRLFDPDRPWESSNISRDTTNVASPLYYASHQGLFKLVIQLLEKGADVNAWGGGYGNALQAASANGHKAVVTLLLDKGANVNTQGGTYGSALQAASNGGHEAVVALLLEKGADVNTQGGAYSNAL